MGRSGSERGDPEDDMEMDLRVAGGGSFDDFGGEVPAEFRGSGSDAWESVGASPGVCFVSFLQWLDDVDPCHTLLVV